MVATLVKKSRSQEEGWLDPPNRATPVVFTRDYVKHRLFSTPPIFYYEILGGRQCRKDNDNDR
jgi:hypothetical protein